MRLSEKLGYADSRSSLINDTRHFHFLYFQKMKEFIPTQLNDKMYCDVIAGKCKYAESTKIYYICNCYYYAVLLVLDRDGRHIPNE